VTITHDEPRLSVVTTRRARRQLDDAAGFLELAAFAALMCGSVEDIARMSACTDAITVLADLGALNEVDAELADGAEPIAAAVGVAPGDRSGRVRRPPSRRGGRSARDDLERRFVTR
jgi:hypothetical protein